MRLFKYISILAVTALGAYFLFFRDNPYQEISGRTFGTYYNVKIRTEHKNRLLLQKIKNELEQINAEMSVFEPGSEINNINDAAAGQPIDLSDNMSDVMRSAREVYRLTEGSFDPTVGQLVDLWGFGAGRHADIPTDEQIKETLKTVGFNKLSFSDNYKTLQKNNRSLMLNLSAIAKGYAVDRIALLLSRKDIKTLSSISAEKFMPPEKNRMQTKAGISALPCPSWTTPLNKMRRLSACVIWLLPLPETTAITTIKTTNAILTPFRRKPATR